MIKQITDAYVRHYSDSGQVTAYVEWLDRRGQPGRTEGKAERIGDTHYYVGQHMGALLSRAERELGHMPRVEVW